MLRAYLKQTTLISEKLSSISRTIGCKAASDDERCGLPVGPMIVTKIMKHRTHKLKNSNKKLLVALFLITA